MNTTLKTLALCVVIAASSAIASAQTVINVSSDIAVSQVWTKNNIYNLTQQIYVLPGASLTIEAGTVVASTANAGGSLAVTKGAQIFVNGTQAEPVIMTSTADTATWTGGNPKTGTWRQAANEWGNLTIMGDAYISENINGAAVPNTPTPNASNYAVMEGLVASSPTDTRVRYGGGNDDDDSGSISYLSLRYAGKVVALNNELNGLSLGGIGRETEIDHVEVMNNVDDGIEIWGGTVNLKYVSIWNVGDDSFDVDQGWRGKVQFALIVQGWSLSAAQGSGVGDNCFETDGAEQSDYQPVTTSVIYNATVIGQPFGAQSGDHAMAFRDNARIQYRNCVFMDIGDRVVSFDNQDGDGGLGYGFGGTLSWANTWTTPYTATSTVNPPANPAAFYTAQTSGNLIEITDSVFFNNTSASAYTEANAQGVFAVANNNVQANLSPITSITRGPNTILNGNLLMQRVLTLDPRPANDALTSVGQAPADCFFCWAPYRGAFAPGVNWLQDWTASQAFGMTPTNFVSPATAAGQPGVDGGALFDINEARNAAGRLVGDVADLTGPHYAFASCTEPMRITVDGEPNQPAILLAGSVLNPGAFNLNLVLPGSGQIDVGNGLPVFPFIDAVVLADGTLPDFWNSLWNTGPFGRTNLTLPAYLPPGTVFNLQTVVYNSATFFRCSNAVQLTIL
jgi:hypothetical protein